MRHEDGGVRTDAVLLICRALRRDVDRPTAVRVDDHGGDPLSQHRLAVIEVSGQTFAGMRVHVDEAGRDVLATRIHDRARPRLRECTDTDDPPAAHADIRLARRAAGTVEDQAVANEDVVVNRRLCRPCEGHQGPDTGDHHSHESGGAAHAAR